MRIPGWSKGYTVMLNGKEVLSGTEVAAYAVLDRTCKAGDSVSIAFETAPVVVDRGQGMAVQYGALVYSLPIKAKTTLTTDDGGIGKCSEEYPSIQLQPRSTWSYALSASLKPEDIEVIKTPVEGYLWENPPIKLKVSGRSVKNWKLRHHQEVPPFPEKVETTSDAMLTLQPLGTTLLRVTEFPRTGPGALQQGCYPEDAQREQDELARVGKIDEAKRGNTVGDSDLRQHTWEAEDGKLEIKCAIVEQSEQDEQTDPLQRFKRQDTSAVLFYQMFGKGVGNGDA